MTNENSEAPMEMSEQRGLGRSVGDVLVGGGILKMYAGYINLMTDNQGGFNVMIMDDKDLYINPSEAYLFPSMVTEEEARQKYDEFVVPSLREMVSRVKSS